MGLGAYPATGDRWIGMLGMHGTFEANWAMHDCDFMLCIGARFDDRITGRTDAFSPNSFKVHIDHQPFSDQCENDSAEIIGAANMPVPHHDRGEHSVLLNRKIAQAQTQLLAVDMAVVTGDGFALRHDAIGGVRKTLANKVERFERIRTCCVEDLAPINVARFGLLRLVVLAHGYWANVGRRGLTISAQ
jgi:hypothetical protein